MKRAVKSNTIIIPWKVNSLIFQNNLFPKLYPIKKRGIQPNFMIMTL